MKVKRWLSLLLTLSLCLGLLPGVTLATEEGNRNVLPDGYEQMYVQNGSGYTTVVEGEAGVGGDTWLYRWDDVNDVYTVLNDTEVYTITCDKKLGEVGKGRNGTNWRKQSAQIGAEGFIYADNGEFRYAIKARITVNPELIYDDNGYSQFPVPAGREQAFTFPTIIYPDGEAVRITPEDYDFTCDENIGSLFWHEQFNELGINTSEITENANGKIYAKHTNGTIYSCSVTVVGTGGNLGDGEDEPMLKTGVYTTLSDKQLSGFVEMAPINGGANGYNVTYVSRQSVTIYYYHPDQTCSSDSKDIEIAGVAAEEVGGLTGVQSITLVSGKTGTISVDVSSKDSSGNGRNFPVVFDDSTDGSVVEEEYTQMYYQFKEGNYGSDIETNINSRTALVNNLFADSSGSTKLDVTTFTFSFSEKNLGDVVDGGRCWDTNNNAVAGSSGFLLAVSKNGDAKYAIPVSIRATDKPDIGENENEGSEPPSLEVGLYNLLTDGQLSGLITKNGDFYTVSYTSGQTLTIYYYNPELICASEASCVEVTALGGGIYSILLKAGQSGSIEAGFSLKNGEQAVGGFRMKFTDWPQGTSQMYYKPESGSCVTNIEISVGSSQALNGKLFADQNGTTSIDLGSYTLSFSKDGLGSIIKPPDGNTVWVTGGVTAEASGYLYAVKGDQKYAIAVSVVTQGGESGGNGGNESGDNSGIEEGYAQMYYQFIPGSYATDIELSLGGRLSLEEENLFADAQGTVAITKGNGFEFSLSNEDLGRIVPPFDPKVWEADDSARVGASGYLYAVKGDKKYAIAVSVKERSGPPSGNQDVMLTEERALLASDKRVIDWETFDWDAIDTITYKGVTYCVGSLRTFPVGEITVLQPDRNGGGQGEIRIGRCVGFYQPGPEGTIITPEPSVVAELVAGFNGTLKLDLYAVTNPDSEYYTDYAKNYPATYSFNGFTMWPCRIAHQFTKGTDGRWLIEVTGTFTDENGNTKQVCTQTTYTNENPPIVEYEATSLEDANQKLAQWAEEIDPRLRYFLDLPEGEWTGTLIIPQGSNVFIRGNKKTTIVGGVQVNGGEVVIQGVHFVGAGKTAPTGDEHVWGPRGTLNKPSWRGIWESTYEKQWHKTWSKGSSLAGKPNYAIYGTGAVQIQQSSFQGYLHVIHCAKDGYGKGVIGGAMESTFRDNAVVYYLDGHTRGRANCDMLRNEFVRNGCVLWVDGYASGRDTGVYRYLSCRFIENQIDAVNLSKRWFFMDHNFFVGEDADGNDVIGPVFMGHNGNVNKKETYVSAFPYAADAAFHELIYDKDAIISSGKTNENKIPKEELAGMTITIIENDQEAAVWFFGEEE